MKKLFNKKPHITELNGFKNITNEQKDLLRVKKFFKKTYLWIFILAILITLGLSGGIYWFMSSTKTQIEKPEQASSRFLEYIKSGDGTSSYNMTDDAFKKVVKQNDFEDYIVKPNIEKIKTGKIEIVEKAIAKKDDKDYMSIVYRINTVNDKNYFLAYKLYRVELQWKIESILFANQPLALIPINE